MAEPEMSDTTEQSDELEAEPFEAVEAGGEETQPDAGASSDGAEAEATGEEPEEEGEEGFGLLVIGAVAAAVLWVISQLGGEPDSGGPPGI